jgi:hypothetical protein
MPRNFANPMKFMINFTMMMLYVLEAVVERGIEPLASAAAGGRDVSGRASAKAFQKKSPPAAPKPPPAGKKELIAALEKSELESVVFGMNLGPDPCQTATFFQTIFQLILITKLGKPVQKKDKDSFDQSARWKMPFLALKTWNFWQPLR